MITGNSPKITVIIPVYAAEQYLRPCLDSVLSQTYQNFELLLIDDGSPDRSGAICDEYAKKDRRITVFHRENQGVSGARNFGMEKASGEYLLFIDADDLVLPDCIQKLYDTISHEDPYSIAMCGMAALIGDTLTETPEQLTEYQKGRDCLYSQYLNPIITRKIHGSSCRILYSSALLSDKHIVFPQCKIAEDQLFLLEVMSNCRRIRICREPLYIYRLSHLSSSHRSYITHYLKDRLFYLERLQQILEAASLTQEQKQCLLSFAFQFYRMLLYMNATASPEHRREIAEIDESPFGTWKVSRESARRFSAQLGKKHRVLNFLTSHRLFFLIRLLRNLKENSR